jgi:hypothetical protein
VDQCEPDVLADAVVAPDLSDADVVVVTQAPGDIHHPGRHVQVKRSAQPGEMGPLRQRLEVIDRLAGLDLDHGLDPPAAFR